jgi:uncharacterized membrane protein YedE/YeeE
MNEILTNPWPWYVAGPIFGITIPLLLFFGNKMLGASTTMQHVCAALIPSKAEYFNYDWKAGLWNIVFAIGVVLAGLVGKLYLNNPKPVGISENTKRDLMELGISDLSGLLPSQIFGYDQLLSFNGLFFMVLGGFLVGFGVRYAGGCTSGHGFMGLSQGSVSSLIAIVSFFAGGLIVTHLFFPIIF